VREVLFSPRIDGETGDEFHGGGEHGLRLIAMR
jgi:hypothetical protein